MIRFTKVAKNYPNGTGLALTDVTFHVARGEFVFLTGHSGAGKSTLLKLMYGGEQPSSGDVRVSGFHIGALKHDEVPRLRRRLPGAGHPLSSRDHGGRPAGSGCVGMHRLRRLLRPLPGAGDLHRLITE